MIPFELLEEQIGMLRIHWQVDGEPNRHWRGFQPFCRRRRRGYGRLNKRIRLPFRDDGDSFQKHLIPKYDSFVKLLNWIAVIFCGIPFRLLCECGGLLVCSDAGLCRICCIGWLHRLYSKPSPSLPRNSRSAASHGSSSLCWYHIRNEQCIVEEPKKMLITVLVLYSYHNNKYFYLSRVFDVIYVLVFIHALIINKRRSVLDIETIVPIWNRVTFGGAFICNVTSAHSDLTKHGFSHRWLITHQMFYPKIRNKPNGYSQIKRQTEIPLFDSS